MTDTDQLPAIRPVYYPVQVRDPDIDHLLRWATSGAEMPIGGRWQLINMPGSYDREKLQVRRAALSKAAIGKSERKPAARAITEMLLCYRNATRANEDVRDVVTKYVTELHDLPTWAIEMACNAIRLGQAKNISMTYPPSTIELRVLVLSYLKPLRDEMINIDQVLTAEKYREPISDAERQRVGVKMKNLADELRDKASDEFSEETKSEMARKSLIGKVGEAAFDAIPNAPVR